MKWSNKGCTLFGLLLNSGWNCTATKKLQAGFSIASTNLPSGLVPENTILALSLIHI